ncbi:MULTISPECIES: dihydrofolate reductase family protein [unclassified Synechococcus]|uniref:dihydrofolate reductase family protein n=1 Tax=unclassified Synechococcus TaxID=2626047 RepID=UPI0003022CE4|nr:MULTISPECIES: dihydrofolate reductase family protein [unclassified Synechococcus]
MARLSAGPLPQVRLVLAISLDGRLAPPAGGAAQLGGAGDRRVLEEALAWADGALIGGGTLRAHHSTCLIRNPQLREQRMQQGRPAQPTALVVSQADAFPQHWPFFGQPIRRLLLSPAKDGAIPSGFDGRLPLAERWPGTLQTLAQRGLSRLLLLGGARLCAGLLQDDAVDGLQLTLTPRLLGGEHCWLPADTLGLPADLGSSAAWGLEAVERLEGDELMLRYRRQRSTRV